MTTDDKSPGPIMEKTSKTDILTWRQDICLTSSLHHNYVATGKEFNYYARVDTTDIAADDEPSHVLREYKCSFCGHIIYNPPTNTTIQK